jgi:non-heme chloroperoxidase
VRRLLAALAVLISAALAGPASADGLRFSTAISRDGVPINVVEAGERGKPAILLIHGFSQSYLSWMAQLQEPELTQRYHLIALDLRGHGGSGKPWRARDYAASRRWADDVDAALQLSGARRPLIVGWSYGGYVALDYLRHRRAGAAAGLMLVGSHAGLLPRPPGGAVPPESDLDAQRAAARAFMAVMSAAPLSPEATARGEASFLMLPPYARRAFMGRNLDNRDLAPRLALPIRFLIGEKDPTAAPDALSDLSAVLPQGAGVAIAPGQGHSPFAEDPAAFAAQLAAFREAVR